MTDVFLPPPPGSERFAIAWRAVWPLLVVGLGALAFMVWTDARFPERAFPIVPQATPAYIEQLRLGLAPNTASWTDFAIFFSLAWFLKFKSHVMGRRLQLDPVDWLAISLILANLFFSFLYDLFLASSVYPYWIATHHTEIVWLQNGIRIGLVATVAASIVLLILTNEPDRVRWPWVHSRLGPLLAGVAAGLLVVAIVADDDPPRDPCAIGFDPSRQIGAVVAVDNDGGCATSVLGDR